MCTLEYRCICVRVCTPSYSSPLPVGPQIVHFGMVERVEEAGYYAGILASSFAVAQFLSGPIWGNISDSVGRRPILLAGSLATCVSSLCFGFSQNFPMAVLFRSLAGFLGGAAALWIVAWTFMTCVFVIQFFSPSAGSSPALMCRVHDIFLPCRAVSCP